LRRFAKNLTNDGRNANVSEYGVRRCNAAFFCFSCFSFDSPVAEKQKTEETKESGVTSPHSTFQTLAALRANCSIAAV
jgi:hypothetical protein